MNKKEINILGVLSDLGYVVEWGAPVPRAGVQKVLFEFLGKGFGQYGWVSCLRGDWPNPQKYIAFVGCERNWGQERYVYFVPKKKEV